MDLTGPKSRWGCIHSLLQVLRKKPLPCLFQLLGATCMLGPWPLPSSESAVAGQVLLTRNHSTTLLPPFSTCKGPVLVCWGCHNKVPQTGGLANRNVSSHSSGGWRPKTKGVGSILPLRAEREWSAPGLSLWLVDDTFPLCLHMVFPLYLPVSKFPPLKRTQSYSIRPRFNKLILRLPLQRPYFQIGSHSEVTGIRISTYEWRGGGPVQPKHPCDYIGPTWIIQDNLLILRSAN